MLPRRNILIFHQAALGDFVTTWPLAMALGRVFAQSRVMYVTGTDKGRLAEDVIGVEGVSADAGWHALHGNTEPPEPILKLLRGTQCVVLFAEGDEATFVGNLAKHVGDVPMIHVRPKPPAGVHVLQHQLNQLDGDGKLRGYVEQMQTLLRTHGVGRGRTAGGPIAIHPGSGSPAKNWPLASFIEVAAALKAAGRSVQFVVGEVEREKWPAGDLKRLADTGPVISPADLPALRRVLTAAAGFVGNDSGPAHLAAALAVPTVALFGPASDAALWQPTGPKVAVLPFESRVDNVLAALGAMA